MHKALTFIRLDFITVKPYITMKNLLIFAMVAIIMMISSGTSISAIAMLMVFAALYVSYPFAISEKNGIDALYATLAIKRNKVVVGRYLYALTVDVIAGLLAYGFSFAVMTMVRKEFNAVESMVGTFVLIYLYSIIQAVQLPIYFKLGYAKAKFIAYLPFVGLTFIAIIAANFLKDNFKTVQINAILDWLAANPFLTALTAAIIWFMIMAISCQSAKAYYSKRDF
ncbi:MAG: ABC-2 transporter permease [Bacillota bacterium]|nr:ABC-2 transporter permease [Bacillota bacterium]